jgi:uncharacterized protein (DUF302 family)
MLRVNSALKLSAVEASLRQSAQRHGAQVLSVIHLGHLLKNARPESSQDVIVFNVCQPDLGGALLSADIRFCAYLPCRIAAFEYAGGVVLEAIPPTDACRLLGLPELERMAMLLEATLAEIMQEASQPAPAHHHVVARHGDVGATEVQMNVRGSIPQRIDCHGTKVEDLAGTGQHDAAGG